MRRGTFTSVGLSGQSSGACVPSDNPNFGITHFDTFWGAFITIFQSITLEGWTDNMYWTQDGVHLYTWIYYVLVVTFGAFLVVQLFLAVLSDAFANESAK
ncbi:Ion transport protein-domain-containing protein, partial [Pavlovales sp. CCMP2436]